LDLREWSFGGFRVWETARSLVRLDKVKFKQKLFYLGIYIEQ
jgi:hypothetical protein